MSKGQEFKKKHVLLMHALFTVAVPFIVWLAMELLNYMICGVHTMNSTVDWTTLMRNLVSSFCFALGLNCNLPVGRMDTSTGSQMYLACIIGGNIALSMNLGGVGVLVFSMLMGMIAGGFAGFLFVKLRILPMVLGLGLSLIYECISFSVYDQQGLNLFGKPGVKILSNQAFIVLVTLLIMAVMTYLFQYSTFGYNRRAIQGNQKLANDAGINIYKNAVMCYIAAGALVAIAGVFDTAYKSSLVPVLGMSSNSTVFANMFPMAVGVWLAKKSSPVIGILAGSLSVQFLVLGLAKFTNVGMSDYMQTCIKYSIWLIFMIYRMNEDKISFIKNKRARIALAKQTRAKRAAAVAA
ncbi:MAG: ABC transporter permease [Oscillospiraceae bacterium]|nr:ABC transporter permease [Oscillospiraceae bacterium]